MIMMMMGMRDLGGGVYSDGGSRYKPGWITSWGAGSVMTSPAGPLGRLCSCSAPLLAALSHNHVCLGKISNVKPLQHPEHAAKGRHDGGDSGKEKWRLMGEGTVEVCLGESGQGEDENEKWERL